MNTLGKKIRVTSFGESHGPGVGVVIDGFPAGIQVDIAAIQDELSRRRPGQSAITTQRREADLLQVLSGLFENHTTGAPITFFIPNEDARPEDYDQLRTAYRPSHADYTYQAKYGIRDHRGGGRSSARVTAGWVAAGALARQWLAPKGIAIDAYVSRIGSQAPEVAIPPQVLPPDTLALRWANPLRMPLPEAEADPYYAYLDSIRTEGDTVGGIISGQITGLPPGLGDPVFGKLHARLGEAMLSINAAKGFEYGAGFAAAAMRGSQANDRFVADAQGRVGTVTNFSGGIQGGISNGEPVTFRVAFKPVATLLQPQETIDNAGQPTQITGRGRHDPCVVPRAVPIVEALACLVVMDLF